MKIGVFPGTFDPVTFGHLDIIYRASKILDYLIVGIASNKRKNPLFTSSERLKILKNQLIRQNFPENIKVKVFDGLLVDFMLEEKSNLIIRGLRVASDFNHEFQMSCINKKLNSEIETIFLVALEENQFISSTIVKEIARLGGDIEKFLPAEIGKLLSIKINKQQN